MSIEEKMPVRIQRRRSKGWKMPDGAVYVGRPSLFGNPFTVEEWGQAGAVEVFRVWLEHHPHGKAMANFAQTQLRGKDLACWCPLVDKENNPVLCHADVLLTISNSC